MPPQPEKRPWTRRLAEAVRRGLAPVFNVGLSRPRDQLTRLGVRDPQFIGWAQTHGYELEELWTRCPRADWLLELALGARLRKEMITEAVEMCLEAMAAEEVAGFDALDAAARDALGRWIAGEVRPEALLEPFSDAVVAVLDDSRRLRRARRSAVMKTTAPPMFTRNVRDIGPNADLEFLHGLANRVRDSVPLEALREAVDNRGHDREGAPYR